MTTYRKSSIAVIFVSQRNGNDTTGYEQAAADMVELAEQQPGFLGVDSVRDANGHGITVSYWESESAAKAWRDDPAHSAIREQGRAKYYDNYSLHVANVSRSYDWQRDGD